MDFFLKLFDDEGFPPRWHCGDWTSAHGYLHIVSDLLIFGAYLAIPVVLISFVSRRQDVPFPRMFWLFGFFIVFCGFTHLNEAIIFWHPFYRFAGVLKLATAVVSCAAVFALIRIMPQALSLRSPQQLEGEVRERTMDLRRSEQRFELVVEAAPSGMLMINSDGTIALVNRKVEELFGFGRGELLGSQLDVLIPNRLREKHHRHVEEFLRSPAARSIGAGRELFGKKKDGSEFPVEIGLNPIEEEGELRVLATVLDITERKQAERTRERLITDLRRSNDELGQFAYVASHDLQEPLRAVVTYTQLLADEYGGKLDGEANKYMDFIVEGGLRMQQLVIDLLAYSRVGTKEKEKQLISAERAVTRAVANLEVAISESGGSVTHDVLPEVMADATQLVQLFQNLVSNGLKFHRDGVPAHVHVSAEEEAERWVFSVRDNGIGFDPEFSERIFRPFQRLHARGSYAGSGIGLAIAKKIVERHQGTIHVESVVGQGSTFFFSLPKVTLEQKEESYA